MAESAEGKSLADPQASPEWTPTAAIDKAKEGDTTALRLCLDRLAPVRRDRPIVFTLPPVKSAADAIEAHATILAGVAAGELSPAEAGDLAAIVDRAVKAIETGDLAMRIARLEAAGPNR